jgi:hypothetical protein
MALRDISLVRDEEVAFGVKRTSMGERGWVAQSRLTQSGNGSVGRRNWTFAGSDEGGRRAAAIYTLIASAKLNDIDPQPWLADILARLPDHPAKRVYELLPWNWPQRTCEAA